MKLAFCALAVLPLTFFAEGGLPNQPYIYVEGKAELEKPADMATLRFDVVARAADEQKANAEVQGKANKVLELAKERKIPNDDVIAGSLRSEPRFEIQENYQKARQAHRVHRHATFRSESARRGELSEADGRPHSRHRR